MREIEQLYRKMDVARYKPASPGMKAVVLLSGGMDSVVTLYLMKSIGWDVQSVSFNYGQSHSKENDAAASIASNMGIDHTVVNISQFLTVLTRGKTALTDHKINVPKMEDVKEGEIPITYVPLRNPLLLTIAAQLAFRDGASGIAFGANAIDYSGYPDCRPEFVTSFDIMVNLAVADTGSNFYVLAPIVNLTKAEIVKLGEYLGVPWELTWSCYRGGKEPCGDCPACVLRIKGFAEAGIKDAALKNEVSPTNIISSEHAASSTPSRRIDPEEDEQPGENTR
tara:strand:+ start:4940 stop:5782 length:843 start_codon:yes stop_codon:yes gene_type:complete